MIRTLIEVYAAMLNGVLFRPTPAAFRRRADEALSALPIGRHSTHPIGRRPCGDLPL
jgi:hypothetical protein